MSYRIVFTDTVKSDFCDIAAYIADFAKDKNLAICLVKELHEYTKVLEIFPESGAIPRDRILKVTVIVSWYTRIISSSICMRKMKTRSTLWLFLTANGLYV